MCRRRGLPEPDRQFVVRTASGRVYLDVRWLDIRLVVEIDGSGHRDGLALVDDHLRQNRASLEEDVVLRYSLWALRLREAAVLDQVCRAHEVLSRRRGRLTRTVVRFRSASRARVHHCGCPAGGAPCQGADVPDGPFQTTMLRYRSRFRALPDHCSGRSAHHPTCGHILAMATPTTTISDLITYRGP
jgi:very-short-patch-repair endonuclease